MPKKLVLVSLDRDLLDLLLEGDHGQCLGYLATRNEGIDEAPHLGDDSDWPRFKGQTAPVMALDQPSVKARVLEIYGRDGFETIIAKDGHRSVRAQVGRGCVLQRRVLLSAGARLGELVKVNVGAQIHHDVEIGALSTIAPGAILLGKVAVGKGAYIGAGAIVRQGIRIGDGAVVGAGAVVVKDVPAGQTVVGNPAKPLG